MLWGLKGCEPTSGQVLKSTLYGASLVAQWLRVCLPMKETRVRALIWEDPTCRGATKPVRHNYWACILEPPSHNYWAHVTQLLKPMRLEPVLRNKKSHHSEKPAHRNEDQMQPKTNKWINKQVFTKLKKKKSTLHDLPPALKSWRALQGWDSGIVRWKGFKYWWVDEVALESHLVCLKFSKGKSLCGVNLLTLWGLFVA